MQVLRRTCRHPVAASSCAAMSEKILERNRGKHIGHAVEAHLEALLDRIPVIVKIQPDEIVEGQSTVRPDIVYSDGSGKIQVILIVVYWENYNSSEKKLYRTRSEYREIRQHRREAPESYSDGFKIITVIYGTIGGWKAQILEDLRSQCNPLIFLPDIIDNTDLEGLVSGIFSTYSTAWKSGSKIAKETVYAHTANKVLSSAEISIQNAILDQLRGEPYAADDVIPTATTVRVPSSAFSTRLRQSLSYLSLFPEDEVAEWHARRTLTSAGCERFARRAWFLGMGEYAIAASIVSAKTVRFALQSAIVDDKYNPSRPDFSAWLDYELPKLDTVLKQHRALTKEPTQVFAAGARDQAWGNVDSIMQVLSEELDAFLDAIVQRNLAAAWIIIENCRPVTAHPSHPAREGAGIRPLLASLGSAVAVATGDRSARGAFNDIAKLRGADGRLVDLLKVIADSDVIRQHLRELQAFCEEYPSLTTESLAARRRPTLLNRDEPSSITAGIYNTLVTNSSHNPLNVIVWEWLRETHKPYRWSGWPARRSIAAMASNDGERRQWQFVGMLPHQLACVDVKSITANNWGNKSKELYDRALATRLAAQEQGLQCYLLLIIDGDISSDCLLELTAKKLYDQVYSIDEIFNEIKV